MAKKPQIKGPEPDSDDDGSDDLDPNQIAHWVVNQQGDGDTNGDTGEESDPG